MRLLTVQQVAETLGVSVSFVWRKAKTDPTFPKPIRLSPGITRWDDEEVKNWVLTHKQESCDETG